MTKLEEVARAICAANDFSKWCGCGGRCDDMQNRARAALMAMRGPTKEMLAASNRPDGVLVEIFDAMINVALGEK